METKKIYPCVRCAESTFNKKIAPKLRRWGYDAYPLFFGRCAPPPFVVTGCIYEPSIRVVSARYTLDKGAGQYLCANIPEFLEKAKELAIERGWFKEEGEPDRLQVSIRAYYDKFK